MFDSTQLLLLGTGLSLGLLHAFDADHIMAVSSLSQRRVSMGGRVAFFGRWALGHSVTIVLLAGLLLAFDWQLSESAGLWAERAIGLLLLVAGGWLMLRLYPPALLLSRPALLLSKPTLRLHQHHHGDLCHTHLIDHRRTHDNHLPVLVGIVHGIAGSAPLLALLPSLIEGSPMLGAGYIMLFSAGVLLSMLGLGVVLSKVQHWLLARSDAVFNYAKGALGALTFAFGGFWLAGTL